MNLFKVFRFSYVETWVKDIVPFAAVYGCEYGKIPLPSILDVEYCLFNAEGGSIQREQNATPYVLQARGFYHFHLIPGSLLSN